MDPVERALRSGGVREEAKKLEEDGGTIAGVWCVGLRFCWELAAAHLPPAHTASCKLLCPSFLQTRPPTQPFFALLPLLPLLPHLFWPLLLLLLLCPIPTTPTTPGANLPALRHWLKSIRESTYLTVQFAAAHLGPAFWRHEQLASIIPQVCAGSLVVS